MLTGVPVITLKGVCVIRRTVVPAITLAGVHPAFRRKIWERNGGAGAIFLLRDGGNRNKSLYLRSIIKISKAMRKFVSVLLVAAVALLTAMPAQAQLFKWGVKAGVNMTKLDFDDYNYKDKMAGFFVGPMTEITIPVVGLGVDASLLFSQKGIKADHDRTKQYGLDIPINLKYTFGLGSSLGIFVAAGPDFYFDFKGGGGMLDRKNAQVGVNVGAGLKLVQHLQIGANYNIPTGDHFDWKGLYGKGKDKTWQIWLAYIF